MPQLIVPPVQPGKRLTQHQKIVLIMCREPERWFYPYDFMDSGLGELFVGYKAPTRIAELAHDCPEMFEERAVGKYVQRRIKRETIAEWFPMLTKPLKQIVSKQLNYYPHLPEDMR